MTLSKHIKDIESHTDFVFNYDVACADTLILDYNFSQDYSVENIKNFFFHSPIDIKIESNQIVLTALTKKRFNICGSVKSKIDDSAFPFANVLVGENKGGQTNEAGTFDIFIDAYKNEEVQISYLGFKSQSFMIQEFTDCIDVRLELDDELLSEEIIIKDYISKGISEGHSYGAFEFKLKEVNQRNEIIEQDVLKKVQLLPGIYSPDDSASNLNIRGSSTDHNLISWEGVSLYDNGHFFGMVSSINPFQLEELKVHKSIHDPSFENRIGGIIEMNLSDRVDDPLSFSVGSNMTEAHANLSIPLFHNKARIIIGGRRSLFDLVEESPTIDSYAIKIFQGTRLIDEEEGDESVEQELSLLYGDINTKLIVQANNAWKFESSILYSFDDFDYSSLIPFDEYETTDTLSSSTFAISNKLSYQHASGDLTKVQVSFSNFESNNFFRIRDLNVSQNFFEEELNNKISDLGAKISHHKSINNHSLVFGYTFDEKKLENRYYENSDFELAKESESFTEAKYHHIFANDAFKWNKLNLQLGARFSYAQLQSDFRFSPRLSVRYKLSPEITLKAGGGIFYQYLRQLYETGGSELNLSSSFWTLPDMEDESILSSRKVTAGAVYKKNNWLIDVEGYYHLTTGLSAENPNIKNQFIVDDMGQLISTGLDVLISKRIKQFQSSFYYSLSGQLVYFPFYNEDEEEFFPANTDQRHVFNWSNKYSFNNFSVVGIYQYRTGLPYTLASDVVELDDDEPEENFELEIDNINEERLRDYHRLDLSANYQYQWRNLHAEISLSVLNILNRENLQSRQYTIANTDETTEEPELLRIEKYQLPRTMLMHFRIFF